MATVQTLIGNVKGPKGDTGATGAQGVQGEAATVNVGSVSTTAYGNPAQVVNVGTENEAVLDFVIPQGRPGQATTSMGGLTLDTITTSTASFPSPQVGDTGATAFGKIVKWFADGLAAITAKLDAANVVNNLTTTEDGYALDARAGKTLNDALEKRMLTGIDKGELSYYTDGTINNTYVNWYLSNGYKFQLNCKSNGYINFEQYDAQSSRTILASVPPMSSGAITLANTVNAYKTRVGSMALISFVVSTQTSVDLSGHISYIAAAVGQGANTNNYNKVSITNNGTTVNIDPNYGTTTKYNAWVLVYGIAV